MSSKKSLFERENFDYRLRIAFDMHSLPQIAEKLGVKYASFWNWAQGRTQMPLETLAHIGLLTGVSLNWLLSGEGERFTVGKKIFNDEEIAQLANRQTFGGLFTIEGFVFELAKINRDFREMLTDAAFERVARLNKDWDESIEAFRDYGEALHEKLMETRRQEFDLQELGTVDEFDVDAAMERHPHEIMPVIEEWVAHEGWELPKDFYGMLANTGYKEMTEDRRKAMILDWKMILDRDREKAKRKDQ
jgi:transcriptional regulator with XRE-family HTH domain